MSKAFTRESDDGPERPELRRPLSSIVGAGRTYLTWDGAEKFRHQLDAVRKEIRTLQALTSPSLADKERLLQLQAQAGQIEQTLANAVVLSLPTEDLDQVRLGAWVGIEFKSGDTAEYRIVGVDEVDLDRGWISSISPMAKALMQSRRGDRVLIRLPQGQQEVRIISVRWKEDGG